MGITHDNCCQGCENSASSPLGPCVCAVSAGGPGRTRRKGAPRTWGTRASGTHKTGTSKDGLGGARGCQARLRWGSCQPRPFRLRRGKGGETNQKG